MVLIPDYSLGGRILIAMTLVLFWVTIAFVPGRLLGYDNTQCTAALMVTSVVMVPFLLLYITIGAGTGEDPNTTPPMAKRHFMKRQR
jgi:ABC-type dipeptide/oligopeptide/nickel transport system permease subunit